MPLDGTFDGVPSEYTVSIPRQGIPGRPQDAGQWGGIAPRTVRQARARCRESDRGVSPGGEPEAGDRRSWFRGVTIVVAALLVLQVIKYLVMFVVFVFTSAAIPFA